MTNAAAVDLIANRLAAGGLLHPGDPENNQPARLIPLPLNNLGLSPGQSEQFAKEAGMPSNDTPRLIGEAVVSLLETDGDLELVPRAELEQLRGDAASLDDLNPTNPVVNVCCSCNPREPILALSLGRAKVITSGRLLRKRLDDVCGCE